jgi:Gpi18-like mannosyltransferase
VIYTEGLFLLCSTAALRAFDKGQYFQTAFWGALSTATRSPGFALIPAFLFVSFKEKRGVKSYLASFATASGILLFSLYCQIKFGDALAFVHVQKGWRESAGFAGEGWWSMIQQIILGPTNVDFSHIQDIYYPLKFGIISISICLLWCFRKQIGSKKADYGIFSLWLLLWLMAQENLIRIVIIYGGVCLLWLSRNRIPLVTVIYGFFTYLLIFNTGLTLSVERYAYGIVSLSIALGLIVNRHPRWGYIIMSFFALVLAKFSIIFAQKLWLS